MRLTNEEKALTTDIQGFDRARATMTQDATEQRATQLTNRRNALARKLDVEVPICEAVAAILDGELAVDAAYAKDTDRHAWAAHHLTSMSKAVIDDVQKVLSRWPPMKTYGQQ